ncbi:uncharacterized protein LOC130823736 [Amaranthus tricolor]|uniref:uncharacterized protein LOC130823736 n=1 Tax=Amaranthus tricolor TaxID=29722 RepID=UPI00258FA782|nr:uncharacterized protein LOC130823736 [Amaranthus tricolor]
MKEELDDGEFWLPSHFLTDDDILMDFDCDTDTKLGSLTATNSDLDFTSRCTETESDEEEILLTGLTHQLTRSNLHDSSCPLHSKGWRLSSSPQSTLYGCMCNQSSSRESGSGPISPPQQPPLTDEKNGAVSETNKNEKATLDLLNKAAGEVARLKMRNEKSVGTGFFDCSQKGVSYLPPLKNLDQTFPPMYFQPQFLHFPSMGWAPSNGMHYNRQLERQSPQNRATKNDTNNTNNNTGNNNPPLGLPASAWPPLQAQAQNKAQTQAQPLPPLFVAPKRECAGTGVFLPRRVAAPANETRKKSDGNTSTKSKGGKGSQSQSNNHHRRNSGKSSTTATTTTTINYNDIQLPQEWTY